MADYEVFISFKNSDALDQRTPDADMAESLYYALEERGIHTFYSNISLKESGESSFRKAIDTALAESRVLVAVGTRSEYLSASQVDGEIIQFRNDMLSGAKPLGSAQLFTYVSSDLPVNQLPNGLRQYQSCTDQSDLITRIFNFLRNGAGVSEAIPMLKPMPKRQPTYKTVTVGTVLNNRYEILHLMGTGPCTCVYSAMDKLRKAPVAVKIVRREGIRDFNTVQLTVDAELLFSLDHPSIPKTYEVMSLEDAFVIVMDRIEGTPLSRIINENGALEEGKVLDVGRQLGSILRYLHNLRKPIIYRDMKPANIFLRPDGGFSLLDFGISREYKIDNLDDTVCMGTLGYTAPEQLGSEYGLGKVDARTDIYNLGATLYHLTTGRSPADPPYRMYPIRQINPKLSHGLEYIIQKCTQVNPEDRFQTAQEFLDALESIDKLSAQLRRKALFQKLNPFSK